jgi:hypothetical protein
MSISAIAATPPPAPIKPVADIDTKPEVRSDGDIDITRPPPPPAPPALPPGQGTRVNIFA